MAASTYEDVYLTILDIDGPEWAEKLRSRMIVDPVPNNDAMPTTEQTNLLTPAV
jgi:hypothetical protein